MDAASAQVSLLPGEKVFIDIEGLRLTLLNGPSLPPTVANPFEMVRLRVTNARLIFEFMLHSHKKSFAFRGPVVAPLAALDSMMQGTSTGRNKETIMCLELQFRDFQVLSLMFGPPHTKDGSKGVVDFLTSHKVLSNRFPFEHFEARQLVRAPNEHRFGRYVPRRDFARMGIPNASLSLNTTVNANFQLTPSYPPIVCVPVGVSDKDLVTVAQFRTKRRFPVIIWRSPETGMLLRSSQPHVGVGRARCEEDENLLRSASLLNSTSPILMICDARPRLNALANQATTSGGSENTLFYPFSVLEFGNIDNIHGMRSSYEKVLALLCSRREEDCDEWERKMLATGWQKHLYQMLDCARKVAAWLIDGKNSLVHCSDGWDRTSVVCSLVQLMLDPWYRSCEGFATLVEKDWVNYGHMFVWRHGQLGGDDPKAKERSPIFFQFLSCVCQLVGQFPTAFEFTSKFLISLHRESVSGRCGTFHANSPRDREVEQLEEKTTSVWDAFLDENGQILRALRNPLYFSHHGPVLWDPNPSLMRFWYDAMCWPKLEHSQVPGKQSHEDQIRVAVENVCVDFASDALHKSIRLQEEVNLCIQKGDTAQLMLRVRALEEALAQAKYDLKESSVEMALELILDRSWERFSRAASPPVYLNKRDSIALDAVAFQGEKTHQNVNNNRPRPASTPPSSVSGENEPSSDQIMWVPDALAVHCAICQATFTWTLRKHHCRQCGSCVCGSCSANKMIVKAGADPARVCDSCFSDRFFGKRVSK